LVADAFAQDLIPADIKEKRGANQVKSFSDEAGWAAWCWSKASDIDLVWIPDLVRRMAVSSGMTAQGHCDMASQVKEVVGQPPNPSRPPFNKGRRYTSLAAGP